MCVSPLYRLSNLFLNVLTGLPWESAAQLAGISSISSYGAFLIRDAVIEQVISLLSSLYPLPSRSFSLFSVLPIDEPTPLIFITETCQGRRRNFFKI